MGALFAEAASGEPSRANSAVVACLCALIGANRPTQFVPRSHLSGRYPNDQQEPSFQGAGPVSMLGNAGDAYMMNNQVWHRGSPNMTERPRVLGGTTYCKRFVSQRLFPHVDYVLPKHVLEGAEPRLQRFLGRHDKGSYA